MVPNLRVDMETRMRAVLLVKQGQSYRAVGRQLGLNHKKVFSIIDKHRETGYMADKNRSGRPQATTVWEDRGQPGRPPVALHGSSGEAGSIHQRAHKSHASL